MKRLLVAFCIVVTGVALYQVLRTERHQFAKIPASYVEAAPDAAVVGPGRVEPASEEVRVGSELDGRLDRVLVDEGSHLRKGDLIAVLDNRDYSARVELAEAEVASRAAELERVISGSRVEERREAGSAVKEAEASLANARAELTRYQALYAEKLTAREQLEVRQTAVAEAEARLEAARHHRDLVDAAARNEDRSRAEAQVRLARSHLDEVRSLLAKTEIHAPISGVVLRRHYRGGETVAAGAPIVTMGDLSRLRVRMELDERDIARVHLGQEAYCMAAAYGARRFEGKVVRIGQMLGRKSIRTDDPAERADTKVLETLIELAPGPSLPPGLRVDVYMR